MGMHEEAPSAPDTFGIPEYFISEVATEIDGPNVRMVCGVKRGGITHWLFSCVMRADLLIGNSRHCQEAAMEAFNLTQMMDRRKGH
jgi:hypothetical protein